MRILTAAILLAAFASTSLAGPADDERAVRRALGWLAENLDGSSDDGANVSGAGRRIVALAATGFVLAQHPEWKGFEKLRRTVRSGLNRFAAGGSRGLQETWLAGVAAATLGEERLRGRDVTTALRSIARRLEDAQNSDGGWAHGAIGGIDFYPSTLIAATNLSLLALATARDAGVDVDGEAIDRAVAMLREVQSASGAFPYGGPRYRKGLEVGRTASAVVALAALGEKRGMLRRAGAYVHRRVESIPDGHASPAMHVFFGALACRTLGRATWSRFDATVLERVRDAQGRDGALGPIVEGSPDTMGLMGSPKIEAAYVCAFHAAALSLSADASKLVEALRVRLGRFEPPPPAAAPLASVAKPAWRVRAPAPSDLSARSGRALLVGTRGSVVELDAKDGTERRRLEVDLTAKGGRSGRIVFAVPGPNETLVVATAWTAPLDVATIGGIQLQRASFEQRLAAYRPDGGRGREVWSRTVPGPTVDARRVGDRLLLLSGAGGLLTIDLATGETLRDVAVPPVVVNASLAAATDGRVLIAAEKQLVALDASGEEIWRKRGRRRRGVVPPSWGAAAWLGERTVDGRTDGRVTIRDGATGRIEAKVELGSSVAQLLPYRRGEREGVIATTSDGRVHSIRPDGSVAWSYTLPARSESSHPPGALLDGGSVWFGTAAARVVAGVDLATGRARHVVALEPGAHWAVAGGRLFVSTGEETVAYDVGE